MQVKIIGIMKIVKLKIMQILEIICNQVKNESENLKTFSYDESYCRKEMIGHIIRAEQLFNFMKTHDYTGTMQ